LAAVVEPKGISVPAAPPANEATLQGTTPLARPRYFRFQVVVRLRAPATAS